ncbi:insulinoma-associated protein 1a-like [Tubulanus polymorphus]|uniref:insulinoma-associated protein 1a-like n=1 Tax=Tubulanus polymorphus TaxID=672921 RepID=UPI003DA57DA8
MPRSLMVKRQNNIVAVSHRPKYNSDDERSNDSGSDVDINLNTNFGSPDSGYSGQARSPISFAHKDIECGNYNDRDSVCSTPSSTVSNLNVAPHLPIFQSPLYFPAFDRLSISSPYGISLHEQKANLSPSSPSKKRCIDAEKSTKSPRKPKAARKLNFDENKSSPVSGTIIKDFVDEVDGIRHVSGDIDSSLNFVEVTPEAKAELEKIENKIGDYICQLCKERYEDAFQLAQHRCSRIVHVEYRCPECDKVFNCPANLASHRRWHKPRPNQASKNTATPSAPSPPSRIISLNPNLGLSVGGTGTMVPVESDLESDGSISPGSHATTEEGLFDCQMCGKKFRRQAYLRKHMASHLQEDRPYPCQLCGKIFRSEGSRSKHMLQHSTSSNIRDFTCTICGQGLPNKGSLEKHVRMHSNEVFPCKYCSSTFYSSPGLTRHINKCHPSENRQVILLQMPVNRPC